MAREDADPREVAGILKAVPKRNLGELLEVRGITKQGLSRALGKDNGIVGKWVNGTRRMSNADLLQTASMLDVSPLYLLDLSAYEWPNISDLLNLSGEGPNDTRIAMHFDLKWLHAPDEAMPNLIVEDVSFPSSGDGLVRVPVFRALTVEFPILSDGHTMSMEEIRQRLRMELSAIKGDYRDIGALSFAMLDYHLHPDNKFQPQDENVPELLLVAISNAMRAKDR